MTRNSLREKVHTENRKTHFSRHSHITICFFLYTSGLNFRHLSTLVLCCLYTMFNFGTGLPNCFTFNLSSYDSVENGVLRRAPTEFIMQHLENRITYYTPRGKPLSTEQRWLGDKPSVSHGIPVFRLLPPIRMPRMRAHSTLKPMLQLNPQRVTLCGCHSKVSRCVSEVVNEIYSARLLF